MISLRDVSFRYADTAPLVLESVSLEIPDGQFLLLLGRNGAGKTTLVRHCNGLLEPDSGTVEVNGRSVGDDVVAARSTVGMVFQTPRDCFVAATVERDVAFGPENLGLARDEIDRRVSAALAAVRMTQARDARIEHLSGGQQARVAIAGALAMEPAHLVLDEPLSGLDGPAREALLDRLSILHDDGMSIIVVTHDLRDVIGLADRVVVLDDGRIAVDDAPQAVVDRLPAHGVRGL